VEVWQTSNQQRLRLGEEKKKKKEEEEVETTRQKYNGVPYSIGRPKQGNRIDYTSRALCTPVTPFPQMGDAAYRQHGGEGPSHGHSQHAQTIGKDRACSSGIDSILADRETDTQTHITVLRNRSRGRSNHVV